MDEGRFTALSLRAPAASESPHSRLPSAKSCAAQSRGGVCCVSSARSPARCASFCRDRVELGGKNPNTRGANRGRRVSTCANPGLQFLCVTKPVSLNVLLSWGQSTEMSPSRWPGRAGGFPAPSPPLVAPLQQVPPRTPSLLLWGKKKPQMCGFNPPAKVGSKPPESHVWVGEVPVGRVQEPEG